MKSLIFSLILFLGLGINSLTAQVFPMDTSYPENEDDKTLSPYFLVKSDNAEIDQLPLLLTSADVKIAGVIADVTVQQVYKNDGKTPLEAIYVFPASTRAAVYGMTMTIGDRILKAEIQERQKARQTYEDAKKEGRTASLLEQERPNVFQMNVANIMPGDSIIVELKYTELLIPTDRVYEFVYPTVVGPRYSNKSKEGAKDSDKFVETPYQHEGEKPIYKFDIDIELLTGVPLQEITCSTHKLNIDRISSNQAKIELDKSEEYSGNKDFILKYILSGKQIETGLLLSENKKENFFLLMLQPPMRIEPEDIPAREYIFIVDVSGSMHGFPLDVSKSLMKKLLEGLRQTDKFNILFFAGASKMLFKESVEVTIENLAKAEEMLISLKGGGGTELLPALKKVLDIPKSNGFSRSICVITDGYVDVEEETFDLIRTSLNDANMFAFGIGNGVNRYLIEGIARAGMGEPFIVTRSKESEEIVKKFLSYVRSPVMTDIKIEYDGFSVFDIEPKSIPDVFAERPIIIYGKWGDNPAGKIIVSGLAGSKRYSVNIDVSKFSTKLNNEALKYLWARNKIAILSDYASARAKGDFKDDVTKIGIQYNLLTKYTSFVAVDYLKRNNAADSLVSVKQALPLPEGVSDYAVGSGMGMMVSTSRFMGRSGSSSAKGISSSPASNTDNALAPEKQSSIHLKGVTAKLEFEDVEVVEADISLRSGPLIDLVEIQKKVIYPSLARKAGVQGKVFVKALIGKDGRVVRTEIGFTDNIMLNQAAIDAVKKTKFVPATENNKPTTAWVTIPIQFKLDKIKDFGIIETKIGSGKEVKIGSKITFHYIGFYALKGDGEFTNSYKSGKPITYIYGKNKSYKILHSWFDNMKVGGKRNISIPINHHSQIGKIFNGSNRKTEMIFEIELIKVD